MDVLYIPQLDETGGGESPTDGRYRILKRIPEDGRVALADRAVTRIEVTSAEPLRLVVPPLVKGAVRDFFVRLVVVSDEVPEVSFSAPAGETVSFEDAAEETFKCEIGVNTFAITETDEGIFIVNRKMVDIDHEVEFDPCGGELDGTKRTFKLGAAYSELPKPFRAGHTFAGWFTAAEGGVEVIATDRCKTGVTKLFAQWEVYADPFVDYICPAKNLMFVSEDDIPWIVDGSTFVSANGSARSGRIADNGRTSLKTTVAGRGTLAFKWRVSSEETFDKLRLIVDGSEVASISGTVAFTAYAHTITTDGLHTVEWRYDKDGSYSVGSDCGWVDDVVWTRGG